MARITRVMRLTVSQQFCIIYLVHVAKLMLLLLFFVVVFVVVFSTAEAGTNAAHCMCLKVDLSSLQFIVSFF